MKQMVLPRMRKGYSKLQFLFTSQIPRGRAMHVTRRQFVSTAAVATVGLAHASSRLHAIDQKPGEKKFKKAVKINMVKTGETLLEKFKLLKELGFDGIEL